MKDELTFIGLKNTEHTHTHTHKCGSMDLRDQSSSVMQEGVKKSDSRKEFSLGRTGAENNLTLLNSTNEKRNAERRERGMKTLSGL